MSGTVGSLFTGCGGLDLGLEAAGWEIAWGCENDEACRNVLGHRRPDLHVYPDVRELGSDVPEVDMLAGGFPCQDLSYAGRGAGLDGERSALWFDYARAIRLLRPRLVLVENVPGLATRGLGRVLYDLAEAGYVGSWFRLRASYLGAPHRRERIFIAAADAVRERLDGRRGRNAGGTPTGGRHGRAGVARHSAPAADTDGAGREEHGGAQTVRAQHTTSQHGGDGATADAAGSGRRAGKPTGVADARRGSRDQSDPKRGRGAAQPSHDVGDDGPRPVWGPYESAIRRWEAILGRPAPRPTDAGGRLMPEFVEWMLGYPNGWTAGERRTHRLRMLGNSVQVQCGEVVGASLMETYLAGA